LGTVEEARQEAVFAHDQRDGQPGVPHVQLGAQSRRRLPLSQGDEHVGERLPPGTADDHDHRLGRPRHAATAAG